LFRFGLARTKIVFDLCQTFPRQARFGAGAGKFFLECHKVVARFRKFLFHRAQTLLGKLRFGRSSRELFLEGDDVCLRFLILRSQPIARLFQDARFLFFCVNRSARHLQLLLPLRGEVLLRAQCRFGF
jgi:hypothetical protein